MKIGAWEATLDLYAVLGVPKTATSQQIRTAYRRRIFDSHPDGRRPSERPFAESRAKRINLAATVLLDPVARARYDTLRALRRSAGRTQPKRSRSGGSAYQPEPRETDFWPFTYPTPAPSPPCEVEPPAPPPPISGMNATLLLAASFVLGFAMLAWLASPLEPPRPQLLSGSSAAPTPSHRSAS
jgi:curved DNA-binding protein CbpA